MDGGRTSIDWDEAGLLQGDPDWMLPIMTEVASAFEDGRSLKQQDLADHLGLPSRIVHEMTDKLIEANLLRRSIAGAADEASFTLAKPADKIAIDSILTIAHHSRPTNTHAAWKTLAELKQAERDAAKGRTLADAVKGSLSKT